MRPKSLSATSIEVYEQCPMRFAAESAKRVTTATTGPSAFGSALHETLDTYVGSLLDEQGFVVGPPDPVDLTSLWKQTAPPYVGFDSPYLGEGVAMLNRWCETRLLPPRVLSRETKETFYIDVPGREGEQQRIAYVIDRLDATVNAAGETVLEVVDYKSQWEMVAPDKMRRLIQPNLYALAVSKAYSVDKVAVTLDMLRYEPVTVYFTADDMAHFEEYLYAVTKRIWDDEDPRETLGKGCRYCPRKAVCKTLGKAGDMGYPVTLDLDTLAETKERAMHAKKALENLVSEIDEALLVEHREQESDVVNTGRYVSRATQSRNTSYPASAVLDVLREEAYPFLKVAKTAIDDAAKLGRIAPDEIAQIRARSIVTPGEPRVKVQAA